MLERIRSISPLFLAVVLVPTLLSAIYFGALAEDTFVSESRIMVRSPAKPDVSPIGSIIGTTGLGGAGEESDAVREFLQSRDALTQVNEDGFVQAAYGANDIFVLDRFGGVGGNTIEQLHKYFSEKVAVEVGSNPQVLRIRVEAFDPIEAQTINERMLQRAEALVNALSDRARADAIRFSLEEVNSARENARSASLALAAFRDREGIIDPELQAEVSLGMVAQLQELLIDARTRLRQMRSHTPQASQIPFLRTQVQELDAEIARQTQSIAGGRRSLSANAARYQELQLASQFAEQQLTLALATMQEAEAEARRKQAYLDRIADPSLPDYAAYPRRWRNILATLVLGLLAWGVMAMLLTGIREHRD